MADSRIDIRVSVFGSHGAARDLRRVARAATDAGAQLRAMGEISRTIRWPVMIAGATTFAVAAGSVAVGLTAAAGALTDMAGITATVPALFLAAKTSTRLWAVATSDAVDEIRQLQQAGRALPAGLKAVAPALDQMSGLMATLRQQARLGIAPGLLAGVQAARPAFGLFAAQARGLGSTIGDLAAQAGRMVGSSGWLRDMDVLGRQNQVTVNRLGGAGLALADALRHIMVAAGPLVDWLTATAAGWGEQIRQWAKAGRESGRFTRYFEHTREVLVIVGHTLRNLWRVLLNVFRAGRTAGVGLLRVFEEWTAKLAASTGSAEGQRKLMDAFAVGAENLKAASSAVVALASAFGRLSVNPEFAKVFQSIEDATPSIEKFVKVLTTDLGPHLVATVAGLAEFGAALGTGVWGPYLKIITALARALTWFLGLPVIGHAFIALAATMTTVAVVTRLLAFTRLPALALWLYRLLPLSLRWANAIRIMQLRMWLAATASRLWAGALALVRTAVVGAAAAIRTAVVATWAFTTALLANPLTWIVIGIVAAGAALYMLGVRFDDVKRVALGAVDALVTAAKALANAWLFPIRMMIGAVNLLIRGINSIPDIPTPFGRIGIPNIGEIPNIPMLAQGGTVTGGGWGVVGDAGPELMKMPVGAQVRPLGDDGIAGIGGGEPLHIHLHLDGREIQDVLVDRERRDYLYGRQLEPAQ